MPMKKRSVLVSTSGPRSPGTNLVKAARCEKVTCVMTGNGSCYISKAFAAACRNLGLKLSAHGPIRPGPMGKAERFIQTALPDRLARMRLCPQLRHIARARSSLARMEPHV